MTGLIRTRQSCYGLTDRMLLCVSESDANCLKYRLFRVIGLHRCVDISEASRMCIPIDTEHRETGSAGRVREKRCRYRDRLTVTDGLN